MSEPQSEEELATDVTTNGSGPPNDNGAETISDKNDRDLSALEAVEEREANNNEDDVKVVVDVDGVNERKEYKDVDVQMIEAEDGEKKDNAVEMTEIEEANITQSEDTRIAEAEEVRKEDGLRAEEADELQKEKTENSQEEETRNIEKEQAQEMSRKEAEDVKEEEADSVKHEKVLNTKKEDPLERKNDEIKDMKKEEVEDMRVEKVDRVQNIDMEDMKAEDKLMVEDNKDLIEEMDNGDIGKKSEENKKAGKAKELKKKLISGQKIGQKRELKEKEEGAKTAKEEAEETEDGEKKANEVSTPLGFSMERPVRERKSVERLVEVLERESVKPFVIEKGRGTPLKDIPNVAYKVAKKKPAELTLLHRTLFGRVGKAINHKSHILQFSGFVWHESEDKQKTKVKEKLDKCVKDTLLDYCYLFDIPVLKAKSNARKEELVAMLLDFMVAPYATTDVILSEKEQSTNSKKRKREGTGSGSKSSGLSGKTLKKESVKSKNTLTTKWRSEGGTEDENKADRMGVSADEYASENSEKNEEESESEEAAEYDKDEDDSIKGRQEMRYPKKGGSANSKLSKASAESKKVSFPTTARSPIKASSFKHAKAEDKTNRATKAIRKKNKDVDQPKMKAVSSKTDPEEKASGKKMTKAKAKSRASGDSGPSNEELRKTIIEILTKVDFNTATFTDILKELANHYGMDFTPRKAPIKLMIQEELTKLAEEDDEDEDEEDDGDDK